MANLRIKGDVSGYVDLVSPDVAGAQTINLDRLVETNANGQITVSTDTEHQLTVQSATSGAGGSLKVASSGAYAYNVVQNTNREWRYGLLGGSNFTFTDWSAGPTERLVIDSSGNVGIGTTSPNSKLEINDTITFSNADTFAQLNVKTTDGTLGNMLNIGVDEASELSFLQSLKRGTGYKPLVLQRYGGQVGIGIDNPSGALHVYGGTNAIKAESTVEPGLRLANTAFCTWDIFSGGGGGTAYNNWLTLYRRTGSGGGVRVEHGNLEVITGYVRAARGTVQTVINTPNTAASGNPVNVWSEINANYRVSITPQYSDTHILGTFHIPMNPTGATNILMAIQPWWSTDGGTTKNILAQGNTSVQASRHNLSVSWFRSNNGYDVNDMQNHVVHFRYDHNTTSTITFGFYFRSEGSNNTYFCHSQGNNGTWGWVAPMYLELREVTV